MERINEERIKNTLANHGVIAFPTETVMGLGVYFDDEKAFEKLNKVKGRPENKPYTLMLSNKGNIKDFAYLNEKSLLVIDEFMPGPITILVKARPDIPSWVDLRTGIIGIRVPDYKQTQEVLIAAEKPLLVPSANKSGEKPTLNSIEVKNIFKSEIDYIIEGEAGKQTPSTIVDLTGDDIKIVREGPISLENIKAKIGDKL